MFSVKSLRKHATCVLCIKQILEHILHLLEKSCIKSGMRESYYRRTYKADKLEATGVIHWPENKVPISCDKEF